MAVHGIDAFPSYSSSILKQTLFSFTRAYHENSWCFCINITSYHIKFWAFWDQIQIDGQIGFNRVQPWNEMYLREGRVNESWSAWELLRSQDPESAEGSRIIFLTQIFSANPSHVQNARPTEGEIVRRRMRGSDDEDEDENRDDDEEKDDDANDEETAKDETDDDGEDDEDEEPLETSSPCWSWYWHWCWWKGGWWARKRGGGWEWQGRCMKNEEEESPFFGGSDPPPKACSDIFRGSTPPPPLPWYIKDKRKSQPPILLKKRKLRW